MCGILISTQLVNYEHSPDGNNFIDYKGLTHGLREAIAARGTSDIEFRFLTRLVLRCGRDIVRTGRAEELQGTNRTQLLLRGRACFPSSLKWTFRGTLCL